MASIVTGLCVVACPVASADGNPTCPGADASTASSCTFTTPGEQTFSVPAGVTELTITAVGAAGAPGYYGGGPGGAGASVTATVPVPAGVATLHTEVGSSRIDDGFNGGGTTGGPGGGRGGGASDVRTCAAGAAGCTLTGRPATDPRLVVAGGGGGGTFCGGVGGSAGDAALIGAGDGGSARDSCPGDDGGDAGFGGTSGGAGGSATPSDPTPGMAGAPGQGGSSPFDIHNPEAAGGAGGGGFWGGGSGGDGGGDGAGGAGSSFWVASATDTSLTTDATGIPEVVISYAAPTRLTTTTTLSCTEPTDGQRHKVEAGKEISIQCTAVVHRPPAPRPTPLRASGEIAFTAAPSAAAGERFSPPSCRLTPYSPQGRRCTTTFMTASPGTYTLTAAYGGDARYRRSRGETRLSLEETSPPVP